MAYSFKHKDWTRERGFLEEIAANIVHVFFWREVLYNMSLLLVRMTPQFKAERVFAETTCHLSFGSHWPEPSRPTVIPPAIMRPATGIGAG